MKPTVSVCIPTYNGAAYLAGCLDSVLAQTISDFEVVIADDCSSDQSLEIANRYASRDPRVRVSRNAANLGLVGNWNRCVQLSRGSWIKFVFQDDIVLPECLARMLAAADSSKVPIVSCSREFIFEPGTSDEDREFYADNRSFIEAVYRNSTHRSAEECAETAVRSIGQNFFGEPTAVLLHRGVFETFGWFNPRLYSTCDLEYWIRVASNTGTVHVPETLARFRVHDRSTSAHFKEAVGPRYRIELVDPLLIVHDFAFHPLYENLRRVSTNLRPPIDLAAEFWRRALVAIWFARRAATNPGQPDMSLLEEWRGAVEMYPRLTAIPVKARLIAKWQALKRSMPFVAGRPRALGR